MCEKSVDTAELHYRSKKREHSLSILTKKSFSICLKIVAAFILYLEYKVLIRNDKEIRENQNSAHYNRSVAF